MRKFLCVFLVLLFAMLICGTAVAGVAVTGVGVRFSSINLVPTETKQLTAIVLPPDATNKTVTWSSAQPDIATVNSTGLVTAVSAGVTNITVTTDDGGKTYGCHVTVLDQSGRTQVLDSERVKVHSRIDALVGSQTDPLSTPYTLLGGMATGATHDMVSRGVGGGTAPTAYPFPVGNTALNENEGVRKTAGLFWSRQLAQNLGFPVVIQRQPYNYVYAEFGDPDAPEMTLAMSHLDYSTGSTHANSLTPSMAKHDRWRGPDLKVGPASAYYKIAYRSPYIHDGWLYGAGVQDDGGTTISTLIAAKALMDTGLPIDRRIRIVMASYEDGSPGTPSVANTKNFVDIPYGYASNPSFYCSWAYKLLNREEMPVASYTADSRFPMIIGASYAATPAVSMDFSADVGKEFSLVGGRLAVTLRTGDETLADIINGSANQMPTRAIFAINTSSDKFVQDLKDAAYNRGWSTVSTATELAKVDVKKSTDSADIVLIEINVGQAMEFPTPQYGNNAVVWGMALLSEALDKAGITAADLQLKKAAEGIIDLCFRGGVEDYLGIYMDVPADLIRNPSSGCPGFTLSLGVIPTSTNINNPYVSFYPETVGGVSNVFNITLSIRGNHGNIADHNTASTAIRNAWIGKGFGIGAIGFAACNLYVTHEHPLNSLLYASYKATMKSDPEFFSDISDYVGVAAPQTTTGGVYASNFLGKMNAFGMTIPGNERWLHTANERMKVKSAHQMTKFFADGLLELARYQGPAGAQFMWADIPGLDPDRADLDILDVTVLTYKDAASDILPSHHSGKYLLAATSFDIPMFNDRFPNYITDAKFKLEHETGGVYLPTTTSADYFVLPMRLEFKVKKPADISAKNWRTILDGNINDVASHFSFNVLNGSTVVPLTLPAGQTPDKFFYKRVSKYDSDTLYISVNVAIKNGAYTGVTTVVADSKTDLYRLNPTYTAANHDPFPERNEKTQRGFFVFGGGSNTARFTTPNAIFVAMEEMEDEEEEEEKEKEKCTGCNTYGYLFALAILVVPFAMKRKSK